MASVDIQPEHQAIRVSPLRRAWNNPLVFGAILTVLLSAEYWLLGPYSYVRIHDNADSFFSRVIAAAHSFKINGPSYWLPFMTGGVDRLSQDLSYTHPDFLLNLLLPAWLAYQVLVLLQFLAAVTGTYLLCRQTLRLSLRATQLAVLGFAVFVSGLQYMQLGLYLLPLALWYLDQVRSPQGSMRAAVFKIGLAGLIYGSLSSFPITIPFAAILTVLWFALVIRLRTLREWFELAVFYIAMLLPHVTLLWALLLNAPGSHRAGRQFADISEVWAALGNAPAGIVIFAIPLFVLSPLVIRFRSRQVNYITFLFAFCWFGPLIINLAKYYCAQYLSFLNGFQFDRFYEFAPLFGAIGSACVVDVLLSAELLGAKSGSRLPIAKPLVGGLAAALLCLALYAKYDHLRTLVSEGNEVYLYRSSSLAKLTPSSPESLNALYRVATVSGTIHPAFANAYGMETIDGYPNLYPNRFKLFWESVIEPTTSKNKRIRHYFEDWGNRVYLFGGPEKVLRGDSVYSLDLLSLSNTKYIISTKAILDSRLELVESSHSASKRRFHALSREFTSGRNDLYIYRNPDMLPRAFVAGQIRYFDSIAALNTVLSSEPLASLKNTVFLEDSYRMAKPNSNQQVEQLAPTISLLRYSPDKIQLAVTMREPGVVVVTDTFTPLWTATLDTHSVKVIPAYGSFLGVMVNEGVHTLTFEYRPPYSWSLDRLSKAILGR
jgi:hypothetical protein